MPSPYVPFAVSGVFILTLALIFLKPKNLHEAWATVIGGSLMLLLGLETVGQAMETVTQGFDVLLFLFALMLFSGLLDKARFFEWAAVHAAKAANHSGVTLFRNVFLLGAAITAFLSLDTTAIILTPIVLSFVRRLNLEPRPFLLACAFVSNTGSLLLPVSNLTNLMFQSAFRFQFASFASIMLLPQIVSIAANYWLLKVIFRNDIPARYESEDIPPPHSVIQDKPFFLGACASLVLVLIGYFIASLAGIPAYAIALAGSLMLLVWGLVRKQLDWSLHKEIAWSLFPFVIGLFVVVRAVQNLGIASFAETAMNLCHGNQLYEILLTSAGAGFGSNIINNIPMALLSITILKAAHASTPAQYGALLGCNLGPNLTVAGSLATMLVIMSARKRGVSVAPLLFFKIGLVLTPVLLIVASLALWAVMPVADILK